MTSRMEIYRRDFFVRARVLLSCFDISMRAEKPISAHDAALSYWRHHAPMGYMYAAINIEEKSPVMPAADLQYADITARLI